MIINERPEYSAYCVYVCIYMMHMYMHVYIYTYIHTNYQWHRMGIVESILSGSKTLLINVYSVAHAHAHANFITPTRTLPHLAAFTDYVSAPALLHARHASVKQLIIMNLNILNVAEHLNKAI